MTVGAVVGGEVVLTEVEGEVGLKEVDVAEVGAVVGGEVVLTEVGGEVGLTEVDVGSIVQLYIFVQTRANFTLMAQEPDGPPCKEIFAQFLMSKTTQDSRRKLKCDCSLHVSPALASDITTTRSRRKWKDMCMGRRLLGWSGKLKKKTF